MSSPLFGKTSVTLDPYIQGDVAAGSVDIGNPIKIGGIASSSVPSPVSNGQRVAAYFDLNGYLQTKSIVQGTEAQGVASTSNPLVIGGYASATQPLAVSNGQAVRAYFDLAGRQHVVVDSFGSSLFQASGTYLSTAPTLSNGEQYGLLLDVSGNQKTAEQYAPGAEDNSTNNNVIAVAIRPLKTTPYSWSRFADFGSNATANVSATTANLKSVYCHNVNVASRYIQLHDTATTPSGGAVPKFSFLVPAGGTVEITGVFFGEQGHNFPTGLAFAFSTTEGTYTAGSAADQTTIIMYKN